MLNNDNPTYFVRPKIKFLLLLASFILSVSLATAQNIILPDSIRSNYASAKEYEIAGVTISGAGSLDNGVLISLSGLYVGNKIKVPSETISMAIKNLWKEGFFSDIKIVATKIEGKNIYLEIQVKERPRLSKFVFNGIKKGESDDLKKKLQLNRGKVITENLLVNIKSTTLNHFNKKGYLDCKVVIIQQRDSTLNKSESLTINVTKGRKIKIKEVNFFGTEHVKKSALRHAMKETKRKRWYTIFSTHTLEDADYVKDKDKVIEKFQEKGFRDAKITKDTIYRIGRKFIGIDITVSEGKKYYFRNITWVGNSKYTSKELEKILGINKGDVFNQSLLETRLNMTQNGSDISSLYMDDGYLFFQVSPVEVLVVGDSIDMEIRIYEGKQATINKVTIKGNTKTNDRVIMRELRTRPGELFRRSDIIRSQRELSVLGYFNAEKMGVTPTPHPENGTVDIEYQVEEKSSDQLELSGGFGQGRVLGTLGLSFNNFSTRNMFKKSAWQPLPSGDGQKLSIRAQSNGSFYQSINASFMEPWLGGRKPNSLSITPYYNILSNARPKSDPLYGSMNIFGTSVGLGRRKKIPDDFFSEQYELNYQYYALKNYKNIFSFANGFSNNFNAKYSLSRNSADDITYPKSGSNLTFSAQATPPYSLLKVLMGENINYGDITDNKKYKWIEYYKIKFTSAWYTRLANFSGHPLVLATKFGFGWLGYYNNKLGLTPFERFYLGGSGLTGYNPMDGREIIALRGYDDTKVYNFKTPASDNPGAASIIKYTLELRCPVSLNPSATIYGLVFAEAGNSWGTIREFNPFDVKRSAGVGVRFFLPMFGMLGFDYGWRFDNIPYDPGMQKSQFHFTIGYNLGEL